MIRFRAGSPLSNEVSHDQQARILGVPEKTINYFWDGEKSDLVAAPDKEKNPPALVKTVARTGTP
ncbi:MAG: hypothetical protein STSR0009_17020 [Methanoregula sp.]